MTATTSVLALLTVNLTLTAVLPATAQNARFDTGSAWNPPPRFVLVSTTHGTTFVPHSCLHKKSPGVPEGRC